MRSTVRLLAATVVVASLSVLAGGASGGAATAVPSNCAVNQVTLSATSSQPTFSTGALVHVTVTMHNHSAKACSYALGPVSPNYVLTNAKGVTVWGSCWFGGGPAPCAMYLMRRTLAAGGTYRDHLTWNQRSGHPDVAVPAGRYVFRVNFSGVGRHAATSFLLTRPS
jgi:hypothetical protein